MPAEMHRLREAGFTIALNKEFPLKPEVLAHVAALLFQSDFTIEAEPGRYTGKAIPLDGLVTISAAK